MSCHAVTFIIMMDIQYLPTQRHATPVDLLVVVGGWVGRRY